MGSGLDGGHLSALLFPDTLKRITEDIDRLNATFRADSEGSEFMHIPVFMLYEVGIEVPVAHLEVDQGGLECKV